jgi:hypothetical protein
MTLGSVMAEMTFMREPHWVQCFSAGLYRCLVDPVRVTLSVQIYPGQEPGGQDAHDQTEDRPPHPASTLVLF